MNPESWFLIGHIVCISQWCAFIMVDYAYLGKGRVRPLWLWTTVLVAGELFLGIELNIGFFTLLSIWENVGFVLVSTLLFGGTLAQKLVQLQQAVPPQTGTGGAVLPGSLPVAAAARAMNVKL